MPKSQGPKASLGDIARVAGVSRVTVCYVMRNHPGPSQKTRERILKIANDLGYTPDARIASWMAKVREAKKKDLLPVAWLSTHSEKDAWEKYRFLSPYFRGACARPAARLPDREHLGASGKHFHAPGVADRPPARNRGRHHHASRPPFSSQLELTCRRVPGRLSPGASVAPRHERSFLQPAARAEDGAPIRLSPHRHRPGPERRPEFLSCLPRGSALLSCHHAKG